MGDPFDKMLVLDLDETLIHAALISDTGGHYDRPSDFYVADVQYKVYKRPGVHDFLEHCFSTFKSVGLWTAGTLPYAQEILPHLCDMSRFSFVWGRERCTRQKNMETWEEYWVKDIQKLKKFGFSKSQILCVDDSPEKFERSFGNYIYIPPFEGDPDDGYLVLLRQFLDQLGPLPDMRSVEKRGWVSSFS